MYVHVGVAVEDELQWIPPAPGDLNPISTSFQTQHHFSNKRCPGPLRKHNVWKYFEDDLTNGSRCLIGDCPPERSIVKGRASQLMQHLRTHHKTIFVEVYNLEKLRKESMLEDTQQEDECELNY